MSLHTALRPNRGFHGSLISNITLSHSHRRPECTLHILYVLPPIAFIDPYELELRSDQYTYHYEGTRNLELPIVAVDRDKPGVLLVDVNDVTKKGGNGHLEVEVPLHFRYGVPLEECESSKEAVERGSLEQPWGFITCPLSGTYVRPPLLRLTDVNDASRSKSCARETAHPYPVCSPTLMDIPPVQRHRAARSNRRRGFPGLRDSIGPEE